MCYQPFAVFDHSSEELHLQMINRTLFREVILSEDLTLHYLFIHIGLLFCFQVTCNSCCPCFLCD